MTPAVDRAFQILEYLATVAPEAGATEIANALSINKSTCYNILQSMAKNGVVIRDARFPVYRLGPKLVELGTASRRNVSHRDDIRTMVRPLVEKYGITCLIAQPLPNHRGVVVTDRYMPSRADALSAPIGHVYPITTPAMGRELLAWEDLHDRVLRPADFGLRTESDLEKFLRGVAETRDRGYGKSESEGNENTNAVASAIRGVDGRVSLLLCLFGYSKHFPSADIDKLGKELRGVAEEIATRVHGLTRLH